MTQDIVAELIADAEHRAANPEGVTVRALTPDRSLAEAVAPMLAAQLYPGRVWGPVLYAEPVDGGWDITVQDYGRYVPTTKGAFRR